MGARFPVKTNAARRPLTTRQRQTLACLLSGLSERQAAEVLGISSLTVHEHVRALYRRYGVHSRGELMALWIVPPAAAHCASADRRSASVSADRSFAGRPATIRRP